MLFTSTFIWVMSSREHLLPTKATILALKARKISYIKGHDLLKRKADSL